MPRQRQLGNGCWRFQWSDRNITYRVIKAGQWMWHGRCLSQTTQDHTIHHLPMRRPGDRLLFGRPTHYGWHQINWLWTIQLPHYEWSPRSLHGSVNLSLFWHKHPTTSADTDPRFIHKMITLDCTVLRTQTQTPPRPQLVPQNNHTAKSYQAR